MKRPQISILGKPNVGKSTLFNRLVGKKQSIVSSIEGITRDRVYGKFEWLEKEYDLIDTGGFIHNSDKVIDQEVNFQADIARNNSDLVIFILDGKSEITSGDLMLAKIIKESGKPFILLLNKIDDSKEEINSFEFYRLGLGEPLCLSAQSGRQVGLLLDKIDELNIQDKNYIKDEKAISLAIIGMPNVGKSSLMNAILKEKKSIVTDIAGTTRDSVDSYIKYFGNSIRIIDTAVLRKKSKMDDAIEFYSSLRTVRSIEECHIAAVLIDINKGFNTQDKNIIKYVVEQGKCLVLVVNKWDLIEKETFTMKNIEDDIKYAYPILNYYPIIFISVKNNLKLGKVLEHSLLVFDKYNKKLTTKELNDFLKKIIQKYPPPAVKSKEIKIKYISQVHQAPPVFAVFSNYPELIPESYKRYLLNQLRDEFDFLGVTVKMSYRKNK